MPGVVVSPIARERRHTLSFLTEIRPVAAVYLDTEVDMSAVVAHRAAARAAGRRYSIVSYLLVAAARTLVEHPEANAAVRGRRRLRIGRTTGVHGKLALDRTMNGHRVVLSTVLSNLESTTADERGLDTVQSRIDQLRDGDPATMPEFSGVRLLHRLPWPLRPIVYAAGVRPLRRRPAMVGTFAVSSLGHSVVDGIHSVGGTTVTFGVGRIADRPVVRDGVIVVAPVMRLNLAFDHRVIDGAEAADVLADVKLALERFSRTADRTPAGAQP